MVDQMKVAACLLYAQHMGAPFAYEAEQQYIELLKVEEIADAVEWGIENRFLLKVGHSFIAYADGHAGGVLEKVTIDHLLEEYRNRKG